MCDIHVHSLAQNKQLNVYTSVQFSPPLHAQPIFKPVMFILKFKTIRPSIIPLCSSQHQRLKYPTRNFKPPFSLSEGVFYSCQNSCCLPNVPNELPIQDICTQLQNFKFDFPVTVSLFLFPPQIERCDCDRRQLLSNGRGPHLTSLECT